jgi:hypothetical protein
VQVNEKPKECVLKEEAGSITGITRVFRVSGVTGATIGAAALAAMAAPGLPVANESIDEADITHRHLRVYSRTPKFVDKVVAVSPTYIFDVSVEYRATWAVLTAGDADNPQYVFQRTGGCNLDQVTTRFEKDRKTRIAVYYDDQDTGDEGYQNCEISVPEARQFWVRVCVLSVSDPDVFVKAWRNTVNSAPWKGFPVESVLCSDITYRAVAPPSWYEFTFQFSHVPMTPDGHGGYLYAAAYKNADGEVPSWVSYNGGAGGVANGIKDIHYHDLADFSQLFRI